MYHISYIVKLIEFCGFLLQLVACMGLLIEIAGVLTTVTVYNIGTVVTLHGYMARVSSKLYCHSGSILWQILFSLGEQA